MNLRTYLILVFAFFSLTVSSQTGLEQAVSELMQKPEYKNAAFGMNILDLHSGEDLFSLNADRLLIPASTMKLVSSATAFELLGNAYRFKTTIGYTGRVEKNGELNGDLILIGGADPALGSAYFQDHYMDFWKNWAKAVKDAGIKKVNGNLVLDRTVYDSERIPDTWIWGDMGNYYGVGPNAFSVYDNLFRITFSSPKKADRQTKVIAVDPKIEGMVIDNEVRSANINYDNAYVYGGPLDKARIIRGTIPKGRKAFTIKAAIHQPEEIVAKEFLLNLANSGIFIAGRTEFRKVNKREVTTIYVQESPALGQIAEVLNHESVNLFAEHFLKHLSVEKNGVGNRVEAIDLLKEFWEANGVSTDYLFMEDGSGLSHFNAVAPTFFTHFLRYMAKNDAFIASLPNAGEGTLSRFDKNLFPGQILQAKSGSMTRVRCYSGYLKTDSGNDLVFSIMFNHFSGSHSKLIAEIQKLLSEMKENM